MGLGCYSGGINLYDQIPNAVVQEYLDNGVFVRDSYWSSTFKTTTMSGDCSVLAEFPGKYLSIDLTKTPHRIRCVTK